MWRRLYLHLIQEAKRLGNQAIIANRATGKTQSVRERRTIISTLKALKNPANPQASVHFHPLIKVAPSLEHQGEFNDHYWKPFLRAWSSREDSWNV